MADDDPLQRRVGARVRAARAAEGLSQEQVAQRVGMARSSIANLEAGRQDMAGSLSPELRKFLGFADDGNWEPPAGMDPEVIGLCRAMNLFPGIYTIESCCGHGRRPFCVDFMAESLGVLPLLLYCTDACHTG